MKTTKPALTIVSPNHHSVQFFLPIVTEYLERMIESSWGEIREYIESLNVLNEEDLVLINKNGVPTPRWHQIVENLSNNDVIVKHHSHIVKVRGGFFTLTDEYLERVTSPKKVA